jgi:hypothetical protein
MYMDGAESIAAVGINSHSFSLSPLEWLCQRNQFGLLG